MQLVIVIVIVALKNKVSDVFIKFHFGDFL